MNKMHPVREGAWTGILLQKRQGRDILPVAKVFHDVTAAAS